MSWGASRWGLGKRVRHAAASISFIIGIYRLQPSPVKGSLRLHLGRFAIGYLLPDVSPMTFEARHEVERKESCDEERNAV